MRLPSEARTPEERAQIIAENHATVMGYVEKGLRREGKLPPTRHNLQPERELQNEVVTWLRNNNVCFVRIDVSPRTFFVNGQMIRKPSPLKGWADLILFIRGRAYHVELKAENGRQSDEQKEVEKYVTEVGGCEYYLMKSVTEVERLVKRLVE